MLNGILVFTVCVSLGITIYTAVYTHLYCQSEKKNYFLLCMVAVIIFILGHLLELLSDSGDEAFTALKILYLASTFISTFSFFFVADYCEMRLSALRVRLPMIAVALLIAALMWTTKAHHLMYAAHWVDSGPVRYLHFDPGPLYVPAHFYPFVCIVASLALLCYRLRQWKKYRPRIMLIMLCVSMPLFAELLYLTLLSLMPDSFVFYFTPHALALMSIMFYIGITRYDMFDIAPRATALALDSIREAYVLVDSDMHYLLSNPAACALFRGLASLPKWEPVHSVEGWPPELAGLGTDTERRSVNFCIGEGDGARHYSASVNALPTRGGKRLGWVILIQEITDSVRLLKRLEEEAYTDALTGIYNRRYFMELALMNFTKSVRSGSPCYAIMLDLDFFKRVNDDYGHFAGDEVLRRTAAQMKLSIRSYDLLARYGGEEFVVLLTDIDGEAALQLAERIRHDIAAMQCVCDGHEVSVTASVGLAESSGTKSLEELLRNADSALYAAKAQGRNRTVVYENA
ncbi:MAG: diguanylate cyclase [Clostridiales Family XIII bacterium]|jgi:diguanylate cyclase (GGDEF)-like protein|nr:diguanylate cyclase [Clostridiales Family XIII bacterium]